MAKFNIGDPVFVDEGSRWGAGQYGVVLGFYTNGDIGIQFAQRQTRSNGSNSGHSCDGLGEDGYCWWIYPRHVSLAIPEGITKEEWDRTRNQRAVLEKIKFLDQKFHDRQKRKTNGVKVRRTCRVSPLPLPR